MEQSQNSFSLHHNFLICHIKELYWWNLKLSLWWKKKMGHVHVSDYLCGLIYFRVKINIFFKKEDKVTDLLPDWDTETTLEKSIISNLWCLRKLLPWLLSTYLCKSFSQDMFPCRCVYDITGPLRTLPTVLFLLGRNLSAFLLLMLMLSYISLALCSF